MPARSAELFDRLVEVLRPLAAAAQVHGVDHLPRAQLDLARGLWQQLCQAPGAAAAVWPFALGPLVEALGFCLAGEEAERPADAVWLGPSPSALAGDDAGAAVQRAAGYEVSDYAGLFAGTAPFLATVGRGRWVVRPPARRVAAGHLRVRSGRLCSFDPLDAAAFERSVRALDRRVPLGDHPIHIARWDQQVAAAVVVFDQRPIRGWAPVRFGGDDGPMPVPPLLPMAPVRYALGLADAAEVEGWVAAARQGSTDRATALWNALMGEATPSDGAAPPVAALRGVPAPLDGLGERLRGAAHACCAGAFGLAHDSGVPGHWGLGAGGEVVALAFDLGALRLARDDSAVVLSAAQLGAAAAPIDVRGYRLALVEGPALQVEGPGDGSLGEVRWRTAAGDGDADWTPTAQQQFFWGAARSTYAMPTQASPEVQLRFARPSRSAVLLDRASLARRLWHAAAAADGAAGRWARAGHLGGLLRTLAEGAPQHLDAVLAEIPLAEPLVAPAGASQPTEVRADAVQWTMAGRTLQLQRSQTADRWRVAVDGRPLLCRLTEQRSGSTSAAHYRGRATSARIVDAVPLPLTDPGKLGAVEVRACPEGHEARFAWGGRIGEVAGTAIYVYHELRLVFPEDFAGVAAAIREDSDTGA